MRKCEVTWLQAFEEYARWISLIGMSPRRIAKPWTIRDVSFEPDERVFLMFGFATAPRAMIADVALPTVFARAGRID
ncbi:cytochrome P450 [Bradyrhizobium sp. cir1]|nr:cytochrome P450 [Bradyrhizobium sp. cir1]